MIRHNPIIQSISEWFTRNFSDPSVLGLFFTLVTAIILIQFFGAVLAPILVSVVIAYLLNSGVRYLQRWHIPHLVAVSIVYITFLGLLLFGLLGLLPILWKQLTSLVKELPIAVDKLQVLITNLVHHYPSILGDFQWTSISDQFKTQAPKLGQLLLSISLAGIPGVIEFVLYFILVPLLVFFFLKDSKTITHWASQFLPSNRSLMNNVWGEVNIQIGNYVRGRVIEVIFVGIVSSLTFGVLGLQYAILLGALVGLSVIIPYVGAVIVTIPVLVVALLQWGPTAPFFYL